MPLTKRQQEVLEFIRSFLEQSGYSPTLEEIGRHLGIASLNAVYKHLRALEERGFIKRLSNQARSIQLLEQPTAQSSPTLPLLGFIAAGQPIEAVANLEEISVPEVFLTSGDNYVLRVRGDSMIEEHIQDGDYVIIQHQMHAQNGQVVVALVDNENATLKKYYQESKGIRLQPANAHLEPIWLSPDRVQVQGVVVGVLRHC